MFLRWKWLGLAVVLAGAACSEDTTGPGDPGPIVETSGALQLERFREGGTGNIVPVFAESGTGFDAAEVDSPAAVNDPNRVDPFLLYYEASSSQSVSTIGLITAGDPTLQTIVTSRMQVVGLGDPGSPYALGATDPTVVVDARASENPPVRGARYKMWFEGRGGVGGDESTIMFSTSADGVTWGEFFPCSGFSNVGFASVRVADPTVVLENNVFKMWFEAIDSREGNSDGPGTIGYAESANGLTWTIRDAAGNEGAAAGPVFSADGTGFDALGVNAPGVFVDTNAKTPGERYLMMYEAAASSVDRENRLGLATSSDGLTWSRLDLPVLTPSSDNLSPLPFDSGDLEHPCLLIDPALDSADSRWMTLYYTGDGESGGSPNRIGLAFGRRQLDAE